MATCVLALLSGNAQTTLKAHLQVTLQPAQVLRHVPPPPPLAPTRELHKANKARKQAKRRQASEPAEPRATARAARALASEREANLHDSCLHGAAVAAGPQRRLHAVENVLDVPRGEALLRQLAD